MRAEQKRERYSQALEREKIRGQHKREFVQKGGTAGMMGRGLITGSKGIIQGIKNLDTNSKTQKKKGKSNKNYGLPDFRF